MVPLIVLITRPIPEAGVVALQRKGLHVDMNRLARPLQPAEIRKKMAGCDAIISQITDRIDADVLKVAKGRCRIVSNCAVGVDNIELKAAEQYGIIVTNTPDVLTEATADLTWALMLAAGRRVGEAERRLRAGDWRGWGMLDYLGADVFGRTLGIIGAGRIGTATARRAIGFNMPVNYYSRRAVEGIEAIGAIRKPLHELLADSDYVSLHVPGGPETHHLLDEVAFRRIKPGAILINTARGSVVDQQAMITALQDGRLAAAGLDVYENEPIVAPELLAMENVVLLPHIGSATVSTRTAMAELAAANVIAVLDGKPPLTPVTSKNRD